MSSPSALFGAATFLKRVPDNQRRDRQLQGENESQHCRRMDGQAKSFVDHEERHGPDSDRISPPLPHEEKGHEKDFHDAMSNQVKDRESPIPDQPRQRPGHGFEEGVSFALLHLLLQQKDDHAVDGGIRKDNNENRPDQFEAPIGPLEPESGLIEALFEILQGLHSILARARRTGERNIVLGFNEGSRAKGSCPSVLSPISPKRIGAKESPNKKHSRSEERRVGKECRSRWSPYH